MTKNYLLKKTTKSLPLAWYFKSKHYEKELSKIWTEGWIYACHEKNLKNPLSFITLNISSLDVIILKDKFDNLVAYFNTCRHRGSQICIKKRGNLRNNILTCPYHQWSYNASNGQLLKTSSFRLPKNFQSSKYSLKKINLRLWNGLIFVNLSNKKIKWSIKNMFQDYDTSINKLGLKDFEIGHVWKKKIQCNWKIFWENYSECLHCPNVHPELTNLVPVFNRRLNDIKDDPNWKKLKKTNNPKFQSGLRKGAETWSKDGSAQGHKIKFFLNEKNFPGHIYITTWPSMFLVICVDHIRIVRILPKNSEEIELNVEFLFEKKTNFDPRYDKKNVIDFATLVMTQDGNVCEINQKGLYNNNLKAGILMPEEYEIKRFHDWLRKKLI